MSRKLNNRKDIKKGKKSHLVITKFLFLITDIDVVCNSKYQVD